MASKIKKSLSTEDKRLLDYLGYVSRKPYYTRKPNAAWVASNYYLNDEKLLSSWKRDDIWLGVSIDEVTHFLILDIDKKGITGSQYHNEADIKRIISLFEDYGIYLYPFRSSPSGEGIHLVAFFKEPVRSLGVAKVAKIILNANGFKIESGTLEVMPHLTKENKVAKTCVRLPFQNGFAPLDDELLVTKQYGKINERVEALNWYFKNKYTDPTEIDVKSVGKLPKFLIEPYKFGNKEFKEGKAYWEGKKLSQQGERTGALKRILYYLKESDPEKYGYGFEEERFEAAWEWLKNNHNGVSDTWNVEGAKKCKKELNDEVFGYFNAKTERSIARKIFRQGKLNQASALKRIDAIVAYLLESEGPSGISTNGSSVNVSRLFNQIRTIRDKARNDSAFSVKGLTNIELQTGVNPKTLAKHKNRIHDLWLAWEEQKS